MENKNQSTGVVYSTNDSNELSGSSLLAQDPGFDPQALSLAPASISEPLVGEEQEVARPKSKLLRMGALAGVGVLLIGGVVWVLASSTHRQSNLGVNNPASQYETVQIPLGTLAAGIGVEGISKAKSVTINGTLDVNDSLVVSPSLQPASSRAGQIYYDKNTNQLAYYNGSQYVPLGTGAPVQSVGGLTGSVTLGSGLVSVGGQITNSGVLSVQGLNGNVTLTAGNGIAINGTTISNSGVVSVTSSTPALTVSNDGNGNITLTGSGSGTVSSPGGTTGHVPLFTGAQSIGDSLITQSGLTVTVNGDLSVVTGGLSLSNALTVSNGGTGATSLAANGVIVGAGTGPLSSVAAGGPGLCLISTAGAPTFAACPSGSGVTSLNSLTGALAIANASASGSTVTIDDASTSAKGIASFNATNFSASGGVVNTIQDINTTAAPSFGRLTLSSSQAASAMLVVNNTNVGATGNLLDLQLNGSSKFSVQPNGNVTTTGTINGQTISSSANFTGTLGVTGNTTLTGDLAVNGGDITATGSLNITPTGTLTAGSSTQTLALQGGSSSSFVVTSGANTTTVNFQAPTANVTYRIPTAAAGSYDLCTTAGNCAGTGGGVTTAGGTTNRLAKFTGAQTVGNSTISDNGTTVTTTGTLVVQGGTATIGVANTQTGSLTLAYGSANFSGTVTQGALTANRTYTLPDFDGTVCLSSGNCLGGGGGGANTALSNLTSVAINTSLLPGGTTVDLGSSSAPFRNLYIAGSSASPNTNNYVITGAATGARTITLPDASGTVCLNNSTNCGFLTGTGTAFVQNGNSFGGTGVLGTTDNFGLNLITNGSSRLTLANTGQATFTGNVAVNGGTLSSAGALNVTPGGTLTAGATGQTFILQGDASSTLTATDSGNTTTIGFQAPTANVTYSFATAAAGTYDICTTAGNCVGSGGGVTTGGGTANRLAKFTGAQTIANSTISDNGTVVTTTGDLIVQGGDATIGVANSQVGTLVLADGTANFSGSLTQGALTANHTYTLPDFDGTVCLSSGNCLGGGGGGANTALSNLSSVAINTSLLPGGATIDLGSSSMPFRNLYIAGSSASPASNNFTVTGTATGARTITLPDATGTVCLNGSASCGFATGSGTAFVQGGNTLGAAANLGTNDNFGLNLRTNGTTKVAIAAGGDVSLTGNLAVNGGTLSSSAALAINPGGTLTVGATGQVLTLQGDAGTTLSATGNGFTTTVGFNGTATANVTYNFDRTVANGTYTICTTIGNCAGSGTGVTTTGGTINTIAMFTGGQAIGDSLLSQSGGTVTVGGNLNLTSGNQYKINGTQITSADLSNDANLAKLSASQTFTGNTVAFKNASDSTNAFNIQNVAAARLLTADTTNGQLVLGTASSLDGKLVFSNVSNSNTVTFLPGTPTGNRTLTLPDASGIICTDSGNCAGAGSTLQTAYNFSVGGTTPKIKVDATRLGVDIQDSDGGIGANLFNIRASNNAGLGQVMLGVGSTGAVTLQNSANSTTALRLLTQGGTSVLAGDTQNGKVTLGQGGTLAGTLVFQNATNSNAATLVTAAIGQPTTYTIPDAGAGTATFCLNTGNCLGGAGGGATTALDNLSSVAINTTLLPGTAGTVNLGSGTKPFGDIFLAGTSGTPGTNNFKITGASTSGTRTITLPDASGTVCINANNCNYASSTGSGSYIQNQIASQQSSANFWISGTGRADTSIMAPLVETAVTAGVAAAQTVQPGTTTTNSSTGAGLTLKGGYNSGTDSSGGDVTIQGGNATGSGSLRFGGAVNIDGGTGAFNGAVKIATNNSGNVTIGSTTSTNTITVGQSTGSNVINIGAGAVASANTQTINIGTGATGTGLTSLTLGSGNANSNTAIYGGTGFLSLYSGNTNAASTASGNITLLTGDANGTTSGSGSIYLNVGTATGTLGSINIGTTRASAISLGGATSGQVITVGPTGINSNNTTVHIADATLGVQSVTIGSTNSTSGVTIQAGSSNINLTAGNTVASGDFTLNGGDINSSAAATAAGIAIKPGNTTANDSTGAAASLTGGDTATGTCATSCTGGTATLQGGNASNGSGTRNGGSVYVDAGTGASANGSINIGTVNSANFTIGKTTGSNDGVLQAGHNVTIFNNDSSGTIAIRTGANSANGIQLQDSGSAALLTADTSARSGSGGNLVKIGNSTGTDTALTILKLDSATADPTSNLSALNGGLYYNSTTNKVSLIENGVVKIICNTTDLGCGTGTVTLQNAYTNSTGSSTPEIKLDSTRGGLDIQDANSTITASLFNVRGSNGSGLGTAYFTVDNAAHVGIGAAAPSRTLDIATNDSNNTLPALRLLQGGSGDATIELNTPATSIYLGVDNSAGGTFKISSTAANGAVINSGFYGSTPTGFDSGNAGQSSTTQITSGGSAGTLNSISVYFQNASGNAQVALYADNGSDAPGAFLNNSSSQAVVEGWNTFAMPSTAISASTKYWIGFNVTVGSVEYGQQNVARRAWKFMTYGTWDSPFGTPSSTDANNSYTVYMTYTPSGAVDSFNGNLLSLTTTGQATFKNVSNSTSAFQVQNSSANSILTVKTSDNPSTSNVITNTGFESGTTGWSTKGSPASFNTVSTRHHSGNNALYVEGGNNVDDGAKFSVTLSDSTAYTASFYAMVGTGDANMTTIAAGYSSDGSTDTTPCTINSVTLIPTAWTKVTCYFSTSPSHSGTPYFYVKQTDASNRDMYFDDFILQTDATTYAEPSNGSVDIQGTISSPVTLQGTHNSTNAFNVLNSMGTPILSVDTLDNTNLILNGSFEENDNNWGGTGTNVTFEDPSQSLFGNWSLKVVSNATANAGATYGTGSSAPTTLAASTTYTLSWYAKLSSGTFTDIKGRYTRNGSNFVECIPTYQTVSTTGWTRFSCTFTTDSTGPTGGAQIQIVQTTATARSFWIDGVRLERGAANTGLNGSGGGLSLDAPVTSPFAVRPKSDSTSSFAVQNTGGASIFNVDTMNGRVQVQNNVGNASVLSVNTTAAVNLLQNGNFENGNAVTSVPGWAKLNGAETTFQTATASSQFNSASLNVVTAAGTSNQGAKQTYFFKPNTTYTFSVYAKAATSFSTFDLGTTINGSTTTCISAQSITTSYQRYSCTFTTGATTTASDVVFMRNSNTTSRNFNFDGAQLEQAPVSSTYSDPAGLNLVSNPSFEQSTNGWLAKSTATIGWSPMYTSLYGARSLQVVTPASTNRGASFGYSFQPTTTYTVSFWGRLNTGTAATFSFGRQDNAADVDCLTGQTLDTTWRQYTCTFTTGATINDSSNIYIKDTGTSHTIYLDGITLVTGNAALGYTPPANNIDVEPLYSTVTINSGASPDIQPWQLNANAVTTDGSTLAPRSRPGTVAYNGYVYMLGGGTTVDGQTVASTNNALYAKLNSDGTVGAFAATSNLSTAVSGGGAIAVNGYMYVVGGKTGNANTTGVTTVQYAKINTDGTLGTWAATTTGITAARNDIGIVAYNGYIYAIGGIDTSGNPTNTVYYAKVNADGNITAWTTGNTLTYNASGPAAATANGYIYVMGSGAGGATTTTNYAKINANGSTASWATTAVMPGGAGDTGVVVMNGYLYLVAGFNGSSVVSTVYYAQIAPDNTLAEWQQSAYSLPSARENARPVAANGYMYVFAGDNSGGTTQSNIYYTSGPRVKVNGALDLVGAGGRTLADGSSGGQLTAGDTNIVGSLTVTGSTSLKDGLSLTGAFSLVTANDSTSAFAVMNAANVPQFEIDTTNSRVYIGNPTADSTGALLVLDTKNTSGDPTGVLGGMYYNSNRGKMRCFELDHDTTGYWRDCIESARTSYEYTNEMHTKMSDNILAFFGTNTEIAGEIGHPGLVQMTVSTAGTDTGAEIDGISSNANQVLLGNGDTWRYETVLRINTISTSGERFTTRTGFNDDTASGQDGVDGCYFRQNDTLNSGKWAGVCRSNSVESTCDTTITPTAAAWARLTIVANSAGNSVDFQINGVSKCQVTSNIPTGAGRGTTVMHVIKKDVGNTARTVDMDYMAVEAQFGTSR